MDYLVAYCIYILAIVAIVYIFNWCHLKLEVLRTKHKLLKDLLEHNYETDNIDLNNFLK